MAWYRNGTISVTNGSAVVTGSGTLWVDAGVLNSGDITAGPDGKLYEVLSIQSNTALTLASNYLGSTAIGQSYAIMPIGLLPSALAQQVKATLASANTALQSAILSTAGQSLTSTQQANARANIAALGAGDVGKGYLGKSVAGGVDVTLSTVEDAAEQLELTGTLTANINVIVSATARQRKVKNSTSGAYTVTVKTASGTGLVVGQGKGWTPLACDGTNVVNPIANITGNLSVGGALGVSGARYDIDGWRFVGYNGTELRLGNWESGGEWTEFSTYIQGTKRTSVTSAGLTVIGALGVSGAATLSAGASLPLPSIGGSTSIEFPYYGDANAKTRIVAASTSDHRQTLKIQMNTAQSDSAPVDVVVFDASGNVGVGGALTSAGVLNLLFGNIQFPANQNASGDANTLDDYEEGSWTPVIRGSGTAGTYQTSTATGTYTKIGNLVTLMCAITGLNPTGGGTGDMQITGLPFPKADGANACGGGQFHTIGLSTPTSISFSTRGASSILYVCGMSGNSAVVAPISGFVNGSIIDFSISYNV